MFQFLGEHDHKIKQVSPLQQLEAINDAAMC